MQQGDRAGRPEGHALRQLPAHDRVGRRPLLAARRRPSSRSACRTSSSSCSFAPIPARLSQVSAEQTVELKPMRSQPADTEVVVRTEIRGKGDPIQLDYRLEKAGDRLEDLRRQRARRLAGRELSQQLRPGDRRQRHRRPDRQARRAQQVRCGRGRQELSCCCCRRRSPSREARDDAAHAQAGAAERGQRERRSSSRPARCSSSTRRRSRCCSRFDRLALAWGRAFAIRGAGQAGGARQALRRRRPAAQARSDARRRRRRADQRKPAT